MKYVVEQGILGMAENAVERADKRNSRNYWNNNFAQAFHAREDAEAYRRSLIDRKMSRTFENEIEEEIEREYAEGAMCHVREVSEEYVAEEYLQIH